MDSFTSELSKIGLIGYILKSIKMVFIDGIVLMVLLFLSTNIRKNV